MQHNINTNIERIIAKIDNDFNPDNTDWIPRVGAWCVDAMSQLDILRTQRSKRKLIVKERIAYSDCPLNNEYLKVFDKNGCEIKAIDEINNQKDAGCGCVSHPPTGESTSETSGSDCELTPDTINIVSNPNNDEANIVIAETENGLPNRYNVHHYFVKDIPFIRNYVLVDNNKLELNFDADYVFVETDVIATTYSKVFDCELPVIPNNGLLIEAIAYYCIYKMLCRGYQHPIFNLHASQYGTNPYYEWKTLKEEAKRSVLNQNFDNADNGSKLFRSNLFIDIFDPRN